MIYAVVLSLIVAVLLAHQLGYGAVNYHFEKEISIGGEGGWDYLSIDPAARRLYVTHSTKIVVLDLDTDGCSNVDGLGYISVL